MTFERDDTLDAIELGERVRAGLYLENDLTTEDAFMAISYRLFVAMMRCRDVVEVSFGKTQTWMSAATAKVLGFRVQP